MGNLFYPSIFWGAYFTTIKMNLGINNIKLQIKNKNYNVQVNKQSMHSNSSLVLLEKRSHESILQSMNQSKSYNVFLPTGYAPDDTQFPTIQMAPQHQLGPAI